MMNRDPDRPLIIHLPALSLCDPLKRTHKED